MQSCQCNPQISAFHFGHLRKLLLLYLNNVSICTSTIINAFLNIRRRNFMYFINICKCTGKNFEINTQNIV